MDYKHCANCGDPVKIAHKQEGRIFCSATCFIRWMEDDDG